MRMDGVGRMLVWLYERCLCLYPRAERERFGAEMAWVFARSVEDAAQQGTRWLFKEFLREMRDLPAAIGCAWMRQAGRSDGNVSEIQSGASGHREQERIRWTPRLPQAVIVQLYAQDAQGIIDEALIARVGATLNARAESILLVSRRQIRCPRCDVVFDLGDARQDEDQVCCPQPDCGWETTFRVCRNSWRRRHLFGGSMLPTLEAYRVEYAAAETVQARLHLIDRLLHSFGRDPRTGEVRWPSVGHFVEGKSPKVVQLMESLACGKESTPGLGETKRQWLDMLRLQQGTTLGTDTRCGA
jgi:hypothetical protein